MATTQTPTKLNPEQLEEFKRDALAGMVPADLSRKYNIGIASVYNYKTFLHDRDSITFPNVRGKRPVLHENESGRPLQQSGEESCSEEKIINPADYTCLNVSGIEIIVSKKAKNIAVLPGRVTIDF